MAGAPVRRMLGEIDGKPWIKTALLRPAATRSGAGGAFGRPKCIGGRRGATESRIGPTL